MATLKCGGNSILTLDERITTPSIHIKKDGEHWYVPLFEGEKNSVVENDGYNYTLGGLNVGIYRAAVDREEAEESLLLIADKFFDIAEGTLSKTMEPTITESNISKVGAYSLYFAFNGCTRLTGSVSFPNLTSVDTNGLSHAFNGCTNLKEVHFKSSLSGNSQCTTSNMGCSNATVYFDLP